MIVVYEQIHINIFAKMLAVIYEATLYLPLRCSFVYHWSDFISLLKMTWMVVNVLLLFSASFFKASGGVFLAQNDPGGNRAGTKNSVILSV